MARKRVDWTPAVKALEEYVGELKKSNKKRGQEIVRVVALERDKARAVVEVLDQLSAWLANQKDTADAQWRAAKEGSDAMVIARGQWLAFDLTRIHVEAVKAKHRRAAK